ncbi:hypothetical protein TorRG33x02_091940 [Trema orientale]|uniref:Uncharacterized protein n=1 Tax=Trema orientale TaxID=63057 RepID=A0A2P5FB35_TREOI|nr:hypothetical protein TorRG33x02_091940 [Trema orientale]
MCGGRYLLEELASGKLEVGIVGNGHGFGSPVVKGRRSSRSDSQEEIMIMDSGRRWLKVDKAEGLIVKSTAC